MTDKENATSGKLVAGAENGTGRPISIPHFSTNGHSTQGLNLESIIEQNLITPEQAEAKADESTLLVCATQAIESLADRPDGLQVLDYLKPLIEQLDQAERKKLTKPLYNVLKSKKNFDTFTEGLVKPSTGPAFTPLSLAELLEIPPKEWLID